MQRRSQGLFQRRDGFRQSWDVEVAFGNLRCNAIGTTQRLINAPQEKWRYVYAIAVHGRLVGGGVGRLL